MIDHRQLLATCGGGAVSSTPIRSFQRATISSVVKTRAFDNNPVLQGLLVTSAAPSGQNSASNSQTPSPLSTPVFSRSRSLRMSSGPRRYQQSPSHHFRTTSRTPDLYSFNHSGDISGADSQAKILELTSERTELKESLEFLECERQVLIDSARELRETLQKERSRWKKEIEDLKKQLTDTIAARCRAESQLTQKDLGTNDIQQQMNKLIDELQSKDKQIYSLRKNLESSHSEIKGLTALNNELKQMLTERIKYNGFTNTLQDGGEGLRNMDCGSIVTEMAKLRLELNEKVKIIEDINMHNLSSTSNLGQSKSINPSSDDIESLNKFLDQTVECIKGWPEELSCSSHVQNLMKSLLSAYKLPEQDELSSRMHNINL